MQCAYCRAANDQAEERCVRCGRRLHVAAPRPAPETYSETYLVSGAAAAATAPALESLPGGSPLTLKPTEPHEYQPSLFRDASGVRKVVPIPTLTPLHVSHVSNRNTAARRTVARTPRPHRGVSDTQQALGFSDSPGEVRERPGEAIVCDAPVASPSHRLLASAVDGSLVMTAFGLFLAIFYFSGGEIVLNKQVAPLLAGVAAVLALFYRALWCLADGDTPGMRFAGLRLVDFDGRRPDRDQRTLRQVASLLSVGSAGLGLVWALVDEENLTWHDHISKTFPTPG